MDRVIIEFETEDAKQRFIEWFVRDGGDEHMLEEVGLFITEYDHIDEDFYITVEIEDEQN